MAKSKFEWTLTTGAKCVIEAEYTAQMHRKIADADGIKVDIGEEVYAEHKAIAYVDGKKVGECRYQDFWKLYDSTRTKGVKMISGLPVGFSDMAKAKEYADWATKLVDDGSTDDVKAYRAAEAKKKLEKEIKKARAIIENAEKQDKIRTAAETQKYLRNLNNVLNEGGEGWLPKLVTLEEYEEAKKFLASNKKDV